MAMRRLFMVVGLAVAATSFAVAPGASAPQELGRGHILTGGPWIQFRSITVISDHDSVDGFFLDLSQSLWGRHLSAHVVYNRSGLPYALSMNFHGSTAGTLGRNWRGGCSGEAVDEEGNLDTSADIESCMVPNQSTTVEVTAYYGADLDVVVNDLDP